MSYILDALRRADAERERGHVPGIHAQPTRTAAPSGVARTTHRLGLWGVVIVLLLAIGGLSWRLLGRETGVPTVAVVAAPSPSPSSSSVAAPAATVVSPEAEPSVPAPPARVAAVAPALLAAKPAVASVAAPTRKTSAVLTPRSLPEAHASAAVASYATVYTAEELPEDVRRDLPKLAIGGSIYSESAASRFIIVNGQLLHEGDTVVPGLVLQQIKFKSAVLAFRGYLYRIAL